MSIDWASQTDEFSDPHEVIQENHDSLVRIAQADGPFAARVRRVLERYNYEYEEVDV